MGLFFFIFVKFVSFGGMCIIRKYFIVLFIYVILLIIMMFNLDRGCVLYFGVKYYRYINRKCLLMFFIVVWILVIVIIYCCFYDLIMFWVILCKFVFVIENNVVIEFMKWIIVFIFVVNLVMYFYFVVYI